MNKKRFILASILSISLSFGCSISNQTNNLPVESDVKETQVQKLGISGNVKWPQSFGVKATQSQVAPWGTVSFLYSHDHPTMPDRTIATGLSDANGDFFIDLAPTFTPDMNIIYTLEVLKRIGGAKKSVLTLRTFLKWNGSSWDSITSGGIKINAKTTAVALISDLENHPAKWFIGSLDNSSVPSDVFSDTVLAPARIVWTDNSAQTTKYAELSDIAGTTVTVASGTDPKFVDISADGSKISWTEGTSIKMANISDIAGSTTTLFSGATFKYNITEDGSQVAWRDTDNNCYLADTADIAGTTMTAVTGCTGISISDDAKVIVWTTSHPNRDLKMAMVSDIAGTTTDLGATSNGFNINYDGSKIVYEVPGGYVQKQAMTSDITGTTTTVFNPGLNINIGPKDEISHSRRDLNGGGIFLDGTEIFTTVIGYTAVNSQVKQLLASAQKINDVESIVINVLAADYDPVRFIEFDSGSYSANYPGAGV